MEPGEVVAGRFEIENAWASGGMAVVYRARDVERDVTVALKLLRRGASSSDVARFLREADTLATLSHRHIVRSLDRGVTELGESYIVQEWIEGGTLRDRLRSTPLTPGQTVAIAIAIAEALAEAHRRGIIHRDIKPSNIMLVDGDPDQVKVVDFGIAHIVDGPAQRLTRTGAVIGTVNYMAPEQARGLRSVDARADLFALGAVMYECLTGAEPFGGRNALSMRAKIIALEPRPLLDMVPDLPMELADLLSRLLAKDPADRPLDAAAVIAALEALPELPHRPAPARADHIPGDDSTGAFTCVVLSAPAAPLLGRTIDELRVDVDAAAAAFGCLGAVIDDGSALIMAPRDGSAAERAVATTRAALMLKHAWDSVPIAVAGGQGLARSEQSIDARSTELHGAALLSVFADYGDEPPRHGVLIEPDVAALVGDDFEIGGEPDALRVFSARR